MQRRLLEHVAGQGWGRGASPSAQPLPDSPGWATQSVLYNQLVPTKVREAIRMIEADGWFEVKSSGSSHRQFKHSIKFGRVTIAGKLSDDLAPKTFNSILRQAG